MNSQPTVSVIIPVYNAEKYLRECLDSVVCQTLKDIEVICVDDGSTDSSKRIITEYMEKFRQIRYVNQNNCGAGAARNNALKIAGGQFVLFLDSDDFLAGESVLEMLYSAAVAQNARICGGSLLFLQEDGEKVAACLDGVSFWYEKEGEVRYKEDQTDYYYQRFLYSRMFLMEHQLWFPDYRRYQDPPFFVKAMLQAESFYAIPEAVYVYRTGGAGHVVWTKQKVLDLLQGLRAELQLTAEGGLQTLHNRIVRRMQYFLRVAIRPCRGEDALEIGPALFRLLSSIRTDWFGEGDRELTAFAELAAFAREVRSLRARAETQAMAQGNAPCVSVIVPVYNVEDYIGACLDSLIGQTMKNIEIICVVDGSTDGSEDIVREYAQRDDRIRIICQCNQGLSEARNTGVRQAAGKYLYFVDSDDYIETYALEYLYEEAEKNALDVLLFDGKSVFDPPELEQSLPGTDYCRRNRDYPDVYTGEELYAQMRKDGTFRPMAWLFFINACYYREAGLRFRKGILHEDILFSSEAVLEAYRISHRGKSLYYYRRRENSITVQSETAQNTYGRFVSLMGLVHLVHRGGFSSAVRHSSLYYFQFLRDTIARGFDLLSPEKKEKMPPMSDLQKNAFAEVLGEEHRWELEEPISQEDLESRDYLLYGHLYGISVRPRFTEKDVPEFIQYGELWKNNGYAPDISVIIPVFNSDKYLQECLDSVTGQTKKRIEIICVNDGSQDNSLEILKANAGKDPRITVISQKNRGQSAARNSGAQEAKGKYLYFLDSDDMIRPNALEVLWRRAERHKLDLLLFDADSVFENEQIRARFPQYENYYRSSSGDGGVKMGRDLFVERMKTGEYRCTPCLQLIRRGYYEEAGLGFKEGIIQEDNLSSFLTIIQANRAEHISEPLFVRRVRANSIMTAAKGFRNFFGYLRCGIGMVRFLEERNTHDEAERYGYRLARSLFLQANSVKDNMSYVEQRKLRRLSPEESMWMNLAENGMNG